MNAILFLFDLWQQLIPEAFRGKQIWYEESCQLNREARTEGIEGRFLFEPYRETDCTLQPKTSLALIIRQILAAETF